MTFVQASQAHVPSGKAASCTIQKQSHSLANLRLAISAGDDATQLAHEVYNRPQDERKRLIEEITRVDGDSDFSRPVSGTEGRSQHTLEQAESSEKVKAITLEYYNLARLQENVQCRWMSEWGITSASKRRMRKEASDL